MVLTRVEKEEVGEKLYEEGKTIREIAKQVYMLVRQEIVEQIGVHK